MEESKQFQTFDTAVAAVLCIHGFTPTSVAFTEGKQQFSFASSQYLQQILDSYRSGVLTVNASSYVSVYKDLIRRLRDAQRQTARAGQ
jgi:hypothetical protein